MVLVPPPLIAASRPCVPSCSSHVFSGWYLGGFPFLGSRQFPIATPEGLARRDISACSLCWKEQKVPSPAAIARLSAYCLISRCGAKRSCAWIGTDVDLQGKRISILGKKRTQKEWLSLPQPTASALVDWINMRGEGPGALFISLDRRGRGDRFSGRSVHRIVRSLGEQARLGVVRPHGLRHAAITAALDLTGGNVRAVQRFSRHRDLRTLTLYDDNRLDLGGEIARRLAG